MSLPDSPSSRNLVYAVLITVAAGAAAGRICNASRVYEPELAREAGKSFDQDHRSRWPSSRPQPTPMFSSNDRSRWSTVRALVDEGTFVIGRRDKTKVVASAVCLLAAADPLRAVALAAAGHRTRTTPAEFKGGVAIGGADSGIAFEAGWDGVDKVLNPQTLEYYSSKPPLLSTLMAGLYWLLQWLFGWTLQNDTFTVVRTSLLLVNLLPFITYLWLLARLLDRYAAREWSRIFVLAAACFGTLVTPFLVTFNNHTVAAFSVLFAVYPMLPVLQNNQSRGRQGVDTAPLPDGRGSDRRQPMASAAAFAMSGLFAGFTVCNELPAAAFAAALGGVLLWRAPRRTLLFFVPAVLIPIAALLATNYVALGELSPAYSKFGGPWYEYEGSHWRKPPPDTVKYGIDWASMHETRAEYALNVLIGHHGLFSLSPIWFLAAAAMVWSIWRLRRRAVLVDSEQARGTSLTVLACLTLVVSVVVVAFYLLQSDSLNYGGWTSGLRWLMWLTPLWLLSMLPVVDWLAERRWGRGLALVLLAWSVFSMSYPAWNPWRHPWLYTLLDSGGYIPY